MKIHFICYKICKNRTKKKPTKIQNSSNRAKIEKREIKKSRNKTKQNKQTDRLRTDLYEYKNRRHSEHVTKTKALHQFFVKNTNEIQHKQ